MLNKKMIICLIIITIYISPFLLLGQNSFVVIHDNLDSEIPQYKLLSNNRYNFGNLDAVIPNIMGGISKNILRSSLSIQLLLFKIFSPFLAYTINQIIIRLVAFFGMYFLLSKKIKIEDDFIISGVALTFSLLPFWSMSGLTIAGLPIVLYSFLNIKDNKSNIFDWIILIIVPFYSYFVLSYVFFMFLIGIIFIYDIYSKKKINVTFLFGIILFSVLFLLIEYRLIYNMFINSNYVSHRTEYVPNVMNFIASIKETIQNYIFGQYHAASLQQYFIGFSVAISLVIMLVKKKTNFKLISLLIVTFLISLFYGFWNWEGLNALKNNISILRSFNFSRFHWLHPLFWYLIFAISLKFVQNNWKRYGKYIVVILLIGQISFLFYSSDFVTEYKRSGVTYKEFYSESLFDEIDNYINKEKEDYRVASLGIYPAVALYNGFYTIDGYRFNYPLEYKHEFREIIEKELNKDDNLKKYFDNWGSRCYIFSSELGKNYLYIKTKDKKVNNLKLDTKQMKKIGAEYLFSAVEIVNYKDNNLLFEKKFENNNSPWEIYLYKIN